MTKPLLSVVVVCKGRLKHLVRCLPALLCQSKTLPYEIIVVDYGCPDRACDYCDSFTDKVKCVRVKDNVDTFNFSRALNIGISFAAAPVIYKCDADRLIPCWWLEKTYHNIIDSGLPILNFVVTGDPLKFSDDLYSFPERPTSQSTLTHVDMVFKKEAWKLVRGFDEGMQGWGYEDSDFRYRLNSVYGLQDHPWIPYEGVMINHTDEDSVRFYQEKDKWKSAAKNCERLEKYNRPINPDGYGITENYTFIFHLKDSYVLKVR